MAFRRKEKFEKRFEREETYSDPKKKRRVSLDANIKDIDFKDINLLSRFVTERGRILPRRITGLNAQQQRKVTNGIKRARQMSLLPFLNYGHN